MYLLTFSLEIGISVKIYFSYVSIWLNSNIKDLFEEETKFANIEIELYEKRSFEPKYN